MIRLAAGIVLFRAAAGTAGAAPLPAGTWAPGVQYSVVDSLRSVDPDPRYENWTIHVDVSNAGNADFWAPYSGRIQFKERVVDPVKGDLLQSVVFNPDSGVL